MPTPRLEQFMTAWCDVDADSEDVTNYLRSYPHRGFSLWLQGDFHIAISERSLTPDVLGKLTNINFDDQDAVDAWLRKLWASWFPDAPYPTG